MNNADKIKGNAITTPIKKQAEEQSSRDEQEMLMIELSKYKQKGRKFSNEVIKNLQATKVSKGEFQQ